MNFVWELRLVQGEILFSHLELRISAQMASHSNLHLHIILTFRYLISGTLQNDICLPHQAIFSISYVPVIADRNLLQYWLTLNMSDVELITFRFRLRVHYYFVRKSKSFSFGKQRDCTRGTSCIWMQSLSHYNLSLCLSISNIVSANRSCRSPDRFTCTIGYFLFPCPETCFHIPVKCG